MEAQPSVGHQSQPPSQISKRSAWWWAVPRPNHRVDPAKERRRYLRLNSILPLELRLFDAPSRAWLSDTLQGYTQDVSEGGLCIQVLHLAASHLRWFQDAELRLQLTVYLRAFGEPVKATARIAWLEPLEGHDGHGYRLGITFEQITSADRARLMRYARRVHWFPRIVSVSVAVLMASVGRLVWH